MNKSRFALICIDVFMLFVCFVIVLLCRFVGTSTSDKSRQFTNALRRTRDVVSNEIQRSNSALQKLGNKNKTTTTTNKNVKMKMKMKMKIKISIGHIFLRLFLLICCVETSTNTMSSTLVEYAAYSGAIKTGDKIITKQIQR
jgi:hypothetical protein